jgi:MinD-like ATPase involved in chromosome partitioning or flagellar assembly
MVKLFSYISMLKKGLSDLKAESTIEDFRIIVKVSNQVSVYILSEEEIDIPFIKNYITTCYFITFKEKEEDSYYKEIFQNENIVELSSRKRLSNLLEINDEDKTVSSCPIATFYSYKGGMGRSTTLASCAAYLSNHHEMKIVVIDCDLEAPGFTNYYLEVHDEIIHHNGFIEYMMDIETLEKKPMVSDYLWEVSKEFSGKGLIKVMPAGNLSDEKIENDDILENHRRHYLEGLSRIDIVNKYQTVSNFKTLIDSINKELSPDLILMDSRTGFNDIFGLLAFQFSNIVIGFFGNNAQSSPGLKFFIDNLIKHKSNLTPVIVNSIISRIKPFKSFSRDIDSYLNDINENINLKMFPITRNNILEIIGTEDEDKEDFLRLINGKTFADYNNLFDYIYGLYNYYKIESESNEIANINIEGEKIVEKKEIKEEHSFKIDNKQIDNSHAEIINLSISNFQKKLPQLVISEKNDVQLKIKKKIISNLTDNLPKLYGENINIEEEFSKKKIFYRKSMEDIFNPDKIIILGNKGTGKTYLYEVLKKPKVVEEIRKRANKNHIKYEIFHLVDEKQNKYLNTLQFNDFEIRDTALFFERFWVVYIWDTVMLEAKKRLDYQSSLQFFPLSNDATTAKRFYEIINDIDKYIRIEQDLKDLDEHLKRSGGNKNLIVIFDQLDQVVEPNLWSERIIPLIKYWRYNPFSKISPKLFLRSDLFEKMSNITNIQQLKNHAISIEWDQEEIFGYFFKFILASTENDDFYKYMSFNNDLNFVRQLKQKAGRDHQFPLDEYYLKPLVSTFFGLYASMDNSPRYGESYEWFFKNLKNANDTISLRPFIDLIKISIEKAKKEDNSSTPILPPLFYAHGEARQTAVENHFNDLAKEKGNEDLVYIFKFIREKKSSIEVYQTLYKNEMSILLQEMIKEYTEELQPNKNSIDELIYLLKVNGIISEQFIHRGQLIYSFALLYKYYLGLKNRRNNRRNNRRRY